MIVQANARLDDDGHFVDRSVIGALQPGVPAGAGRPGGLHGRVAQAGRLGGDGADPVPGARRREPRPDGREHAAPGGAPARAPGADRRHRHRGQAARDSGQVVLSRDGRRSRRRARRSRIDDPRRRRRRARVPAAEVRSLQPGHLHQPAAQCGARRSRSRPGEVLADSSSTENGELALGRTSWWPS